MTATLAHTDLTRTDLWRWSFAGIVVLAAHVAAVSAYILTHQADASAGAPVIFLEFAPAPSAPEIGPVDIPDEKPMEKAEIEPEPQDVKPPDEAPPPPPQKAEVVIPAEKPPPPKPVVKPKKPPAPRTVNQAHAPDRGDVASGPQVGSAAASNAEALYKARLAAHLQRFHRYPDTSRARGETMIGFTLDRNGHLLAREIVRSSGSPELDRAALDLLQRAQPLPPFPPAMTQARKDFKAPINFIR